MVQETDIFAADANHVMSVESSSQQNVLLTYQKEAGLPIKPLLLSPSFFATDVNWLGHFPQR